MTTTRVRISALSYLKDVSSSTFITLGGRSVHLVIELNSLKEELSKCYLAFSSCIIQNKSLFLLMILLKIRKSEDHKSKNSQPQSDLINSYSIIPHNSCFELITKY